ncbi:MAG: hypothetical protein M0Q54_12415 [Pigmentiphaga sp.]|nr:hypothetical protein [Pigmentiphaga sp.]
MIWFVGSCIGITLLVLASTLVLEVKALRRGRQSASGRTWLTSIGISIAAWWLIAWVVTYFAGWLIGMKTFVASLVVIGLYGFLSLFFLHSFAARLSKKG